MAILFFQLRGVPYDEADDIRELLTVNEIAFYETSAGSWGMSMPAIWLYHNEDLEKIQPLFDCYQQERAITQRDLYLKQKKQNRHNGFLGAVLKHPLQFIFYSMVLVMTCYLSIKWLFELGL
jgi:hypothetical protein